MLYNLTNIGSIASSGINYILLIYSIEELRVWYLLNQALDVFPLDACQFIFRVLLTLNYLYVLFVILYKYCKKKHNLNRVNDKIKPLVREYQDRYTAGNTIIVNSH